LPPINPITVHAQTQPLGDVSYTSPEETVGLPLSCSMDLKLQPLTITGITVSIPAVTADSNNTAVSVPNVTVSVPGAGFFGVPSADYSCPVIGNGTTTVAVSWPLTTQTEVGSLNMTTGKLALPSALTVQAAITIVIGQAATTTVTFTIPLPPVSVTIP
jgi:hypothetical protein